jgi:hypothetical protein
MKRSFLVVAALSLGACIPYKFSLTAEAPAVPREPLCGFRVVNVVPEKGYSELGVLEFNGGNAATKVEAFREKVQEEVCRAGGDLVVPQINGYGVYVRAIVFKKASEAQASAQ